MSSKRTILGTLITIGTLTMGASVLQANGSDHDRGPANNFVIQQQSSDPSDMQGSVTNTYQKMPLSHDLESYERHR